MKKNVIVYGKYCGVQKRAVELLTEIMLDYLGEYPACVSSDEFCRKENERYIFVGTKESNCVIRGYSKEKLKHEEEYLIRTLNDDVLIEGSDDGGVLYGCIDFYNKFIVANENTNEHFYYFKNIFAEKLPEFYYSSYPAVKERGIWTWGHVIYDFKGFIDHMVKCKMNTIVIWNDFVPLNAKEMIVYAHENHVKIIWGFSWLWRPNCQEVDIFTINNEIEHIIEKYEKEYSELGGDGIYFQSFTELTTEILDGKLIAEVVTDFVNNVSNRLFEKYPKLELQFGLHATSVKERLSYIKKVNTDVRIVWEDCGAFPYAYVPQQVENYKETVAFTEKIMGLRGNKEKFGVVLKGFTALDWKRFEHQRGNYVLGVSSKEIKNLKLERKRKIWRYVQAYWLLNAEKAYEMIQLLQKQSQGNLYITALVEDGMFESKIYFPVALYAEMLWDCSADIRKLITEVALRNYVEFV